MKEPDDKTLSRMQKLLALARRGVGGERANAERFLARLLEQHGMTLDDIEGEGQVRKQVSIAYSTERERKLILQIVAKVLDTSEPSMWKRRGTKAIIFELTPAEHAEVLVCQAAMLPALKRHMDRAFSAFIQANSLCPAPKDGDERPQMDPKEVAAIVGMMSATERVTVNKALPGA